jgi:hypothetical protein
VIAGIVQAPLEHREWETMRALLSASVADSGDTTIEEVERDLGAAEAQLWGVFDKGEPILVAVTRLHLIDGLKEAFCWQMGGDFARGGGVLVPMFLEWAKNEGCAQAEINGRVGWMRVLRDWKPVSVVLRKELA